MSDVTRDEFDRLVERVTRVEQTLGATVEIVAAEVVGLRTYLDERFAAVDARFDRVDARFEHQDRMLDGLGTEVQIEFDRHAALLQRQGRKLDALLAHFDIDIPDA